MRFLPTIGSALLVFLVAVPMAAGYPRQIADSKAPGGDRFQGDITWYGGGGTGNGSVVTGGIWDWEANSGETPQSFPNNVPVGNQFRDGWTFEDRSTSNGPSSLGSGHWRTDGTYDFDFDGGSFAHRATSHPNNGVEDGPPPLTGQWSVWIGTNLELNPENCGWSQTRGYGDGWSQGIRKFYEIGAGNAGAVYAMSFVHRYGVESGFDVCVVEVSENGLPLNPAASFTGGDADNPQPAPGGGPAVVPLATWLDNNPGTLYVRFRLRSDAAFSDRSDGNFMWAWQLDDIQLLRNGEAVEPAATFETGMDGWVPGTFEGFDIQTTGSPTLAAGRVRPVAALNASCPPAFPCELEHNVLMFTDELDCGISNPNVESFATSRAFRIVPALDHYVKFDTYLDGLAGSPAVTICYAYWPYDAGSCPFTPAGGHPGAGSTFNWSQSGGLDCRYFFQGDGPSCVNNFTAELDIPAAAESVIVHIGVSCQGCEPEDNGTPFIDNVQFGVGRPIATGLPGPAAAPEQARGLYAARPNPARPGVAIPYVIDHRGHVRLQIFDVSGRLVRTLVDEVQEPVAGGGHTAVWDGRNNTGERVDSGIFFYEIEAPGLNASKKLLLLE